MEVIRIDYLHVQENLPKSSCCIGFFDGLHTGHQALLENCIAKAKELNIQSGLITFDPDPWKIFFSRLCMSSYHNVRRSYSLGKRDGY